LVVVTAHIKISFNIKDVAINAVNNRAYKDRTVDYFRESVWSEMLLRYISQSSLEESMVNQMDSKLLEGQEGGGFMLDPSLEF